MARQRFGASRSGPMFASHWSSLVSRPRPSARERRRLQWAAATRALCPTARTCRLIQPCKQREHFPGAWRAQTIAQKSPLASFSISNERRRRRRATPMNGVAAPCPAQGVCRPLARRQWPKVPCGRRATLLKEDKWAPRLCWPGENSICARCQLAVRSSQSAGAARNHENKLLTLTLKTAALVYRARNCSAARDSAERLASRLDPSSWKAGQQMEPFGQTRAREHSRHSRVGARKKPKERLSQKGPRVALISVAETFRQCKQRMELAW